MTTGDNPEITFDVLPRKAREYMQKLVKDPKLGAAFLKRAGIMDENGQLAEPYRTSAEEA